MQTNKNKSEDKEPSIPQVPFDDALRKILSAPPKPNTKPKQKNQKKTGK